MTPPYLNPPSSPFPAIELDHNHHEDHLLSSKLSPSSSSSSFHSCPIFSNPSLDHQGGSFYSELHHIQHHQEAQDEHKFVSFGGSYEINNGEKLCENQSGIDSSVKWMSSKMRLMRKMINSDQNGQEQPMKCVQKYVDQKQTTQPFETENSSSNNNANIAIRVCSDCNTTKTPLWRSGPRGPKSLCNACGIRQRKARRAMAAAAAVANGTILAAEPPSMKTKVQYKKRCKLEAPSRGRKKICFEDFTISLSKNSAFQRVFPQDEKEAAILLMALSCGLVHG